MNAFAFGEKIAISPAIKKTIGNLLQTPGQAGQKAMLAARNAPVPGFTAFERLPTGGNKIVAPPLRNLSAQGPMGIKNLSDRRQALIQVRNRAAFDQANKQLLAKGVAAGGLGVGIGAGEMYQQSKNAPVQQPAPEPTAQDKFRTLPLEEQPLPRAHGMIKTQSAREFGAKVASLADNPMAIGAGAGGVLGAGVGALGGGLYGAINPGYDEEGKRKSRLMAALKGLAVGGLGGGAIGAGVGAMGGRAAEMGFGLGREVERDISGLDRDLRGVRAQHRATRELHGLDAPSNAVDPASKARLAQVGSMA